MSEREEEVVEAPEAVEPVEPEPAPDAADAGAAADAAGAEPQASAASAEPDASAATVPVVAMDASPELVATVEALLFLSQDPVRVRDLADACDAEQPEIEDALAKLQRREGGIVLRAISGGWTLASMPEAEKAARRLLAKPRTPPLTQAQAECLSIVAYLQPVSRPEIARIRGVASESAVATLEERGLIEDCGRSQFGAILYRTTALFQRLFGLGSIDALPDPSAFDPSPEDEGELRDRLLRAGEIRAGGPMAAQGQDALPALGDEAAPDPARAEDAADAELDTAADADAADADAAPDPTDAHAGADADPGAADADPSVPDADPSAADADPSVPDADPGADDGDPGPTGLRVVRDSAA